MSLGLPGLSTLGSVRLDDLDSTVELSFSVHLSEGLGTPVALQKRVTLEPLTTCGDCGDTVTSVGTIQGNNSARNNHKLAAIQSNIKCIQV